jgi:hypothetical protein
MIFSPAASQASTTTTIDDCPMSSSLFCQSSLSSVQSTPEKHFQNHQNQYNSFSTPDNKSFSSMNNTTNSLLENCIKNIEHESDFEDVEVKKNHVDANDSIEDVQKKGESCDNFTEGGTEDFLMEVCNESEQHNNFEANAEEASNGEVSCEAPENESKLSTNGDECNNKSNLYDVMEPVSAINDIIICRSFQIPRQR